MKHIVTSVVHLNVLCLMVLLFPSPGNAQANGTWTDAGTLSAARTKHTATPLGNGTVLVAGGVGIGQLPIASAEIYDPGANGWTTIASMVSARYLHTATLLADGRVLVAGGSGGGGALAEVYDPTTGQWTATGTLNRARYAHTASLLPNGMVLVAGGCCDVDGQASLTSSELWDPATGQWAITGDLGAPHAWHTATPLSDGTVLVAGGTFRGTAATASAEIYDPTTGSWTAVGNLLFARSLHTATLLNGDSVLLAGGSGGGCCSGLVSAELYDPASQTWQLVPSMSAPRREHSAAVIQGGAAVLISGGYTCCTDPGPAFDNAEVFDLASQTWSLAAGMSQGRYDYPLTTLADGTVLAAGGTGFSRSSGVQRDPLASAERFNPAAAAPQTTRVTISSNAAEASFTASGTNCNAGTYATPVTLTWTVGSICTLTIPVPGGYVFSGWSDGSQANPRSVTAPAAATTYSFVLTSTSWTAAGTMSDIRARPTATLLGDGTVLVAAGYGIWNVPQGSAEIYDPVSNGWTTAGGMYGGRVTHTATRLLDGRVLVAGGYTSGPHYWPVAEIYDPSTRQWTASGTLNFPRAAHTASLLPNGMVLLAGGCCEADGQTALTSSELWDPATGQWTITGNLGTPRASHTATTLSDGTVLVAGGGPKGTAVTAAAELYDPNTGSWTAVGNLVTARKAHTASLLNGDRVLLTGGNDASGAQLAAAELYDPASRTWQAVQPMSTPRSEHGAAVIKGGAAALIAGGYSCCTGSTPTLASAEVFDLASQTWSPTGSLVQRRYTHTLTTLADGTVLAAGGQDAGQKQPMASAERFHPAP